VRSLPLVLGALGYAAPVLAGTIAGQVQLKEKGGQSANDLSEVVVWVEGVKNVKPKLAGATMTMKAKVFTPHVVVVPVGGTVEFPNQDPIFHNVFSVSPENKFDLELYKRPKSGSWTFKAPGIAKVYCNIHPQMAAIVVVRDNPYYAMVAKDGSYSIEGVPAGKYQLFAWHERAGESALDVTVAGEGSVAANFALDASSYKRVQHKNKFGKDYATGEKY
jgi:plastocyanin